MVFTLDMETFMVEIFPDRNLFLQSYFGIGELRQYMSGKEVQLNLIELGADPDNAKRCYHGQHAEESFKSV